MMIFSQGWSNGFDGPGRRLVYYLKGCNFRCLWCGNPESIAAESEILFYPEKSKFAAESCPYGAVSENGGELNREKCSTCSDRPCVKQWHDRAFELVGKEISPVELVKDAESRRVMFGSDGGVTFSGGEPTLQMDELLDAAKRLRSQGINVAVETNASSARFAELADVFDVIICDLKCVTPELHREMTGKDNRVVIENLCLPIHKIIRVPLIDGLNFTTAEQDKFVEFLTVARPQKVELIRLHQLGLPKYKALGQNCPADAMRPPERKDVEAFSLRLKNAVINSEVLN